MEPVSLALGVLPLAVEVASVACKVKKAIASYKAAPAEVRSLSERVALLESLCQDIEHGLAQQPSSGRVGGRNTVAVALAMCLARLGEVDGMLAKFEASPKKTARIRFVIEKDSLKDTCRDLDSLIHMLHLGIGADVWAAQTVRLTAPMTRESQRGGPLDDAESAVEKPSTGEPLSSVVSLRSSHQPRPAVYRKSRSAELYRGTFGQVSYKQTTKEMRGAEVLTDGVKDQRTVVSVKLPWMPYRLDFQAWQSWLTPLSYSLNVTHVIDRHSELGGKVRAVFLSQDLPTLQNMLSGGELSLFSNFAIDDRANASLFHLAINHRWVELCRLLSRHDPGGKMIDELGEENISVTYYPRKDDEAMPAREEIVDIVVDLKQSNLDCGSLAFVLESLTDPQMAMSILKRFLRHSDEDPSELIATAWVMGVSVLCTFLRHMVREDPQLHDMTRWKPTFRELICMGVDVHQPISTHFELSDSAYSFLWDQLRSDPIDTENCLRKWLAVLEECGVHIPTYLERERHIARRIGNQLGELGDRALTMFNFNGHQAPGWEWATDREGHAMELLEEFSVIAHLPLSYGFRPWSSSCDPVVKYHSRAVQIEFPLRPSVVTVAESDLARRHYPSYDRPAEYVRKLERMVEAHRRRIDRRWVRHTMGKALRTRRKQATMPGSWVEYVQAGAGRPGRTDTEKGALLSKEPTSEEVSSLDTQWVYQFTVRAP